MRRERNTKRQNSIVPNFGVDEEDVHRGFGGCVSAFQAVVRKATNPGGDAGDKTPSAP
jgi:hypothetical protein